MHALHRRDPDRLGRARILAGEIGEYIVTARRKGLDVVHRRHHRLDARDLKVDLSFLGGTRTAELFPRRRNADRKASDYRREEPRLDTARPFEVHLAPGGGFTLKVEAE